MSPNKDILLRKIEDQIEILVVLFRQYESEKILEQEQADAEA